MSALSTSTSQTWIAALLRNPVAPLVTGAVRDLRAQDALVLAAARHLYGRGVELGPWREALRELSDGRLVEPAGAIEAGTSHEITLGRWLYAAVRVTQPHVVIETGVANGASSWLILNALHRNGSGSLHSIDLPNNDPARPYNVGEPLRTGHLVPEALRDRWTLVLEDSRSALPRLIGSVEAVDLFFHDADHSYEAMRWEFETVIPRLAAGGLVVSDDVQKNDAFEQAASGAGMASFLFRKGGAARWSSG